VWVWGEGGYAIFFHFPSFIHCAGTLVSEAVQSNWLFYLYLYVNSYIITLKTEVGMNIQPRESCSEFVKVENLVFET
jgi:hypothetical protein